jgi:hypothetical protein
VATTKKPPLFYVQGGKSGWGAAPSPVDFTPAPPAVPPAGFYDPALDAQDRAGDRGLAQLLQDLGKQGSRAEDQRTIDRGQVNQGADWSLADLLRGSQREGADYGTATGRLGEDHATNTATIGRNYQRLGQSQAGAAQMAGVAQGGTFAAAKAARDTNQGLEQGAEDLGFNRTGADLLRDHMRYGEDNTTSVDRTKTTRDQQLGDVDRLFGYGVVDRADTAQRGTNENTFFGQDVGAQKLYQAGQQGWVAPGTTLPNYNNYLDSTKKKKGTVVAGTQSNVPAAFY